MLAEGGGAELIDGERERTLAAVGAEQEPGSLIAGRFRLDRVLGQGGMGVVWAATHTITRKPVALKLIKGAGDTLRLRSRLMREARAASAARHPNVCDVHDCIELDDGSAVMVMELLVGESLEAHIDPDLKLGLADLAAILLPVVSAVGAAHALGIVHRDLKPANIFLTGAVPGSRWGRGPHAPGQHPGVKVLDFGIAKLTATEGDAAASDALTATGSMLGTPYYMSPEQAFGEKDIDARADVWALGLILYRCLSGVLPTQADNLGQILKNIVARPIRPLEDLEPALPREVTALCARMLSRERKNRPQDLNEVAAVLAPHTDVRVPTFPAPLLPDPPGDAITGATGAAAVDPLAATSRASPTERRDEEPGVTDAGPEPSGSPEPSAGAAVTAGEAPAARGPWWPRMGAAGAAAALIAAALVVHGREAGKAGADARAAWPPPPQPPSAASPLEMATAPAPASPPRPPTDASNGELPARGPQAASFVPGAPGTVTGKSRPSPSAVAPRQAASTTAPSPSARAAPQASPPRDPLDRWND